MLKNHLFLPCLALLACAGPASCAWAVSCASEAVTARGENSRYQWLAKTKARANWRRRVRATPGLGGAYDNWYAAADTEERCISGAKGTLCTFTGRPCRK